jgi:acetoacetyl-CoA reductase
LHLGNKTIESLSRQQNDCLNFFLNTNNSPGQADEMHDDEGLMVEDNLEVKTGIALVTGGIGGIGTAICQRLGEDNTTIVATYIKAEKEYALEWQKAREQEGLSADVIECDVSDFDSCQKASRAIEKKYARVGILVNCAGITRDAMLKKLDKKDWDAVIATNLDSVFNMTRSFIDGMKKRAYGRIINISSVNGQKGQFGQTNYSSSKAGMLGFTRALAVEVANQGITVNCVCPGYVATSMVDAIPDHVKQAIISQIPIGRLATPVEIANAVGFLASEDSAYVTGTELAVNGGLWTG